MEAAAIRSVSLEALAYLGDAVWELHVRQQVVCTPARIRQLHERTVSRVRASAQAQLLQLLLPHLSEAEQDWIRRGRNAVGHIPRHLDPATYRLASGFETLLGYLSLADPARLTAVLHLCDELQIPHGSDTPSP